MNRTTEARLRRLEARSPDVAAGMVVISAASREGERAQIDEATARDEIRDRDLVVVLKRFDPVGGRCEPVRITSGVPLPILAGFAEPAGAPWLSDFAVD